MEDIFPAIGGPGWHPKSNPCLLLHPRTANSVVISPQRGQVCRPRVGLSDWTPLPRWRRRDGSSRIWLEWGTVRFPHSIREIPTYISSQCGRNRICKRERPNANTMIYRVCEGESTSVMILSHHIRAAIGAAVATCKRGKAEKQRLAAV